MSPQERADLGVIPGYLPELKALRAFVDRLVMLFEGGPDRGPTSGRSPSWSRRWGSSRRRRRSVGFQYLNPLLRIWTIGLS